jgi:hypothetical protein
VSKARLIKSSGDYARGFVTQHGKHFRKEVQNIAPAMKRVEEISELQSYATKASNPNEWGYIGSVPKTILVDWLNSHNYTMDEWARNEGGSRCPAGSDPMAHATLDGGVRSKFLRYFLSRDFSKLHTQHVTTRQESNRIAVPGNYKGSGHEEPGRVKDSNS